MTQKIHTSVNPRVKKVLPIYLAICGVAIILIYIVLFGIVRTVPFSYAQQQTCSPGLTLLPDIHKTVDASEYTLVNDGGIAVGPLHILSSQVCVLPTATPHKGETTVSQAPFGWMLYRQQISIRTPDSPRASSASIAKPIPTTKPLSIALEAPDVVNTYQLRANENTTKCMATQNSAKLECDIPSLKLGQGQRYPIELIRSFGGKDYVKVLEGTLETLTATAIVDSSVKDAETVFSRPTEFTFTADKPLTSAEVTLIQDGDGKTVNTKTTIEDERTVKVKMDKELPRQAAYTATVSGVNARDGSTLTDPYVIHFKTSGGPVVTGVSIGKSGVAQGSRIVVTFDQAISEKQDIAKVVTISGGAAAITRSGNQVVYTLQGLGQCAPFTLSVAKGLESKYDIASENAWTYASRTVCYTTTTYGYSVKGRPLVAYNFGTSGPTTMYVGAIHGNEPSSSGLLKTWIDDLEANPTIYSGKRIVVVPTISPDGVAANTRTNARGVNLNRNFPTDGWTKDIKDTDGNHPGGGGESPLSEPEAKALANLSTSVRPRLLLSFHAVGSLVVGDPGGYSAGYAAKYASMVGYRNATGQAGTFEYDITGAYEDWTYTKQGIPSMVIELGSYGYFSFPHHREALRSMLN